MNLIDKIKRFFGFPNWDGYVKDMNAFYDRERKMGAKEWEIQELLEKDKRFVEKFGGIKYANKLQ